MKKTLRFLKRITPTLALAAIMMAPMWGWGQYAGTGTFTKITSVEALTDGYYVILNESDGYVMTNGRSGSATTGYFVSAAITPSGGTITDPSSNNVWKIETNGSGKTIYNESIAKYVGWSSGNSASIEDVPANTNRWTFTYVESKFTVLNVATIDRQLSYNSSSPRFAAYANAGQQELQLYKMGTAPTTPIINITPITLTGFTYVVGSGPSAEQTFTVSGSDLEADISIAATANYEISKTSGAGFTTPLIFTPAEVATPQTVYVRLKAGLAAGNYNNEVINTSSSGATDKTVTCSGSVTAPPDPEPTNHVTSFSATSNSSGQITLNWTDAIGAQLPAAYLVKATINPATPSTPANGIPEADGALVKNITQGTQTAVFSGLVASTSYNFAIWPYTNSGATIAYKTDLAAPQAQATTESISMPDVIITEVYGGGGNLGATLKNDFIELFNTTSSPINISGWSIQYYSATGDGAALLANTLVIPAGKSIPAKSNFLIQAAAGSGGTLDLLLPDASCEIALSGTSGKVILYTTDATQTISTGITSIIGNPNFKDYVPYGANAVPVWGIAMSSNTSSTASATRKTVEGSYVYTQNIGNDFEVIAPTPQNTGIAYFRSQANGNWGDISTWESSSDNNTWIAAVSLPLMKDNVVIDHAVILAADGTADSYNLTINGGGSLNIASDASKSGSLIARGVVSGNTTVQRYLTGGWAGWNTGWHQISSPVAAQAISTFETTGVGNGYDFYGWKEADNLWMNYKDGGFSGWNGGTNFNVGQGYMVSYEAANVTQAYTGVLNAADVTKTNLSYNVATGNGWHLLGNPFASALKWNDGNWTLSNVAGGAKIWNETNKSYSDIAANGFIPSAQGFMVQVSGGTNSMTIPAASRVHNATPFYKSIASSERFLLVAAETEGGSAQESKIIVNPMATEGFDFDYDSRFLAGYAPAFYSVANGQQLSTNSMAALAADKAIPLGFVKNNASAFTIELKESVAGRVVYLTDNITGTTTNLTEQPVYSFTSVAGDQPDRFLLTFGAVGIGEPTAVAPLNAYLSHNRLFVTNTQGQAELQIFDLQGRLLQSRQLLSEGLHSEALTLTAGVYVVRLQSAQATQSVKVIVQ